MMTEGHPGTRPFQSEIGKTVYERMLSGTSLTVILAAAGSGKTKGYFHANQIAYQAGLIDAVAIFAPRVILRRQAEADWEEWRPHYVDPVMGKIVSVTNEEPLTRSDEFGYISTYTALVANPELHLAWARDRAGRFNLVLDEAQFLGIGSNDFDDDGTKAASVIEQIAKYARHTLLTTGTEERSDGNPLVLADYSDPDVKGYRHLQWHVKSTYQDGITLRYLRPGQFSLTNGNITFSDLEVDEISTLERRLHKVLREPTVWKALCGKIVDQLQECRRSWSRYLALISCIDQKHAREVFAYLRKQYPHLNIKLAISDEGKEAETVLNDFRPKERGGRDDGDILVTVGMVSIGYDAATICVVGNLSSRRWEGWLKQFYARGARVWMKGGPPIDEQICYYISTDDPRNRRFAERMRAEIDRGIRDRRKGPTPPPPAPESDVSIIDVEITEEEMLGLNADQDLSAAELAGLRQIKLGSGRYVPETLMAEIFRAAGHPVPTASVENSDKRTGSEKRKKMRADIASLLAKFVYRVYELPTHCPEYRETISKLGAYLNTLQSVENINHCTEEQLRERISLVNEWTTSGIRQ